MKQIIRLTESELHRIVRESVKRIVKESVEEGTPKQNAFLQKLMGDRWKDEYANLSVKDSSAMIDKELASTKNENGPKYEVVEFDKTSECNSFYEAKKKFKEVIDGLDEAGFFRDPDLSMVKVSDVCYRLYGKSSRTCLGSVFIRKKA